MEIDSHLKGEVLKAQRNEITEHEIYKRLSLAMPDKNNREIFARIADDELRHYHFWKRFTGEDVRPRRLIIFLYVFLARVLGLSFSLKLMEKGEDLAQAAYVRLKAVDPYVENVVREEEQHEERLLAMIDEEKLKYTGSMVLGLNDAIVELTGALAGFTLALGRTKIIAMAGIIIGVAASLSMAASEYLSTKEEKDGRHPLKASVYTGVAYLLVVVLLTYPYFVFSNPFASLGLTLGFATLVIFVFNYYISVAKGFSFKQRFAEMFFISLGVTVFNFFVGFLARKYLGIEV
jgi:VIT1/CCC1 family predicted Fe2+/Mn2+ transporter